MTSSPFRDLRHSQEVYRQFVEKNFPRRQVKGKFRASGQRHYFDIVTDICNLCGMSVQEALDKDQVFNCDQTWKGKEAMKSRKELRNTVAMLADNVVSVKCIFTKEEGATVYRFKATREFASDLVKDDIVIAQMNSGRMPFAVVQVVAVDDICLLDNISSIEYCWLIQKVDDTYLKELLAREDELIEKLDKAQRRAVKDKMLEELAISAEDMKQLGNFSINVDNALSEESQ